MSLHSSVTRLAASITPAIIAMLILGFLSVFTSTLIGWTLLLHLNYISFTTPTSSTFYMQLKTLPLLIPIPGNIIVNHFLRSKPTSTLTVFYSVVAIAISILTFTRSRIVYSLAFAVYTLIQSLRIARITILAQVSNKHIRTAVLATHQITVPIGAIAVPLAWLQIQKLRGSMQAPFGVSIDRFTLLHTICASFAFLSAFLASVSLRSLESEIKTVAEEDATENIAHLSEIVPDYGATYSNTADESSDIVLVQMPNRIRRISISGYRFTRFAFFTIFLFGVRLSTMALSNAFQPIFIDVYGASEVELGQAYLIVAVVALIPPLLVALLSEQLSDRTIILVGLSLKTCGLGFFTPLAGVSKWYVLIGNVLLLKASMFLVPAAFSLFTKVMGQLNSGTTSLAWVWSIASIGPALVQICMGRELVEWYGSWKYIVFAAPCLISAGMVVSPVGWAWMDPRSEVARAVVGAVDRSKRCVG